MLWHVLSSLIADDTNLFLNQNTETLYTTMKQQLKC